MKKRKKDMSYEELHRFLKNKYNDYQNVNIYDSNYNYIDLEIGKETFDYDLFIDPHTKTIK